MFSAHVHTAADRPSRQPRVVVFTGVEDSLDVSADACLGDRAGALATLAGEGVPIVFYSARTRLELGTVQQRLGIHDPMVCESGAALLIPIAYFPFPVEGGRRIAGYDVVEFGEPHDDIVGRLRGAARRLGLRVVGFADLSVSEVAADRRLPLLQARLAKFREYEEIVRLVDAGPAGRAQFERALRASGLYLTPADPGYERVSATAGAAPAIKALSHLYRLADRNIRLIGVEPPGGDRSLLNVMDYAVMASAASLVETVHRIAGGDTLFAPGAS